MVDEKGNTYELADKPLGKGGQGIVFRSSSTPDVVVKFCAPPGEGGEAKTLDEGRRRLRRRLEEVRTLPLTGLPVASPLAMLHGHVGYTMRLLEQMGPIGGLIATGSEESLPQFYLDSGGLRRRLEILSQLAWILARLHAVPLVYGDISHNNVFVPEAVDASGVWLIDCDNLDWLPRASTSVYTPYFGAPEVVQHGAHADTLTDVYSFAILAYWVLVLNHPFLGSAVEVNGWDVTTTEDLEEKALRGELPFVDDPSDASNRSDEGVPRAWVLTRQLRELFERTFVDGREDRTARPSMVDFVDAFRRAADMTIWCDECGMTHFVNADSCPWCPSEGSQTGVLSIEIRHWEPRLDEEDWSLLRASKPLWRKVVQAGRTDVITTHMVSAAPLEAANEPELEVSVSRGGVSLSNVSDREFRLVSGPDGSETPLRGEKTLPLPKGRREWFLHCGPADESHRIAFFRYFERGK
ncbi:hypothetical protein [Persicimonas caeni]|uniref:hypothetical protein n=1 Tax=Persicimonas caeni TaxID=2292766 RepID=UPI00143D37FE|nr:hypothetical protein [Persicimonas caeni]